MAKKPKSRSSRQARQARQVRSRLVRRDREADAVRQAAGEAFDRALDAGYFTAAGPHGQPVRVTLDEIRQALDAELAGDGEPPVAGEDELLMLLVEDLEQGGLVPRPDGLWDVRPEYLLQS
ncbi:hypothetical protein ACWD4N_43075 [Streptomyces sp. NPDC002586]